MYIHIHCSIIHSNELGATSVPLDEWIKMCYIHSGIRQV